MPRVLARLLDTNSCKNQPSGTITAASIRTGAIIAARPARAPPFIVSVAIRMMVGPGMDAIEKPMANAMGKFTAE